MQLTIKSLGQSDIHIYTKQRILVLFFFKHSHIYYQCCLITKRLFSLYKNHVKSSGITKMFLKMLSDVFLNENKGFKYCS